MIADESLITELTATIYHAMNEHKKHRQSIRLKGYDYGLNGAYYITICSYQKQYLFGEIVEGNMERNLLGDTVEAVWYRLPLHFKFIELDAFIVMPNHIHGIIVIQNQALEKAAHDSQYPHGTMPESLGAIVQNFKSISTRKINFLCGDRLKIWQRNYYEHIIRNENSYQKIRQYILDNPRNWEQDENNLNKFKPM
jgi:REP element-mobilizing transposase RayT